MTPEPAVAYRHCFTSSADGALGEPGFQTVACAPELEPRLGAIESLVRGYEGAGGGRTRLLVGLPDDERLTALATLEPAGACPDGRPGNFWAETLVVPSAWLANAAWDAEAAFAALDWWGPEAARRFDGWPCRLPREPLEPLAPGPLERLAFLREAAPPEVLGELVAALARWSRVGERVFVAAPAGLDPALLERLILLLPLVLPPPARRRETPGGRRPLALRTLGAAGERPPVDLQGLPAAGAEVAAKPPGALVDLAGGPPPQRPADAAVERYVERWLEILAAGAWAELSFYDRAAEETPAGDPLSALAAPPRRSTTARGAQVSESTPRPPHPPAGPAGEKTPQSPAWAERRAAWEARDDAESRTWELRRRFEADLEQLLATLSEQVRDSEERLRAEIEEQGRTLRRQLGEAQRTLERAATEASETLRADAEHHRDQLEKVLASRRELLARGQKQALEQLRVESERAQRSLRETVDRSSERLAQGRQRAQEPTAAAGEAVPARRSATGRRPWPKRRPRGQETLGPPPWLLPAAALAALLAVAAVVYFLLRAPEPPAGEGTPPAPSRAELDAEARDRLRRGEGAAAVLARAARVPALARDAAELYLELVPPAVGADGVEACALLQAALAAAAPARGRDPIPVDGSCGQQTVAELRAVAAGTCCEGLLGSQATGAGSPLGTCFLERYLGPRESEAGCDGGDWPLAAGRRWTAAQAGRLLELLRAAAGAPGAGGLRRYDLAASPEAARSLAGRTLAEDDVDTLLQLASLALGEQPGASPPDPGSLSREELAAILEILPAPGGGSPEAPPG